jgi:hypothetical protein
MALIHLGGGAIEMADKWFAAMVPFLGRMKRD